MIVRTGSLTASITGDAVGLRPHTALRYELPDAALRPYLTNYHVFDSEGPEAEGAVGWFLPSWPAIRVILADRPISLTVGNRHYDPLPVASLYGTTTRAMRIVSNGGVTVGIEIGAIGWSRLFRHPADQFRDRIVPLDEVLAPGVVDELVNVLRGCDLERDLKAVLDRFFLRHLGPPSPDEATILEIARLIRDAGTHDIATAAAAVGINRTALRRLSTRYFGFPPKTLLMRTRFMRAFLPMLTGAAGAGYGDVLGSYHDTSHFLRDANRFLGMTPRRFIELQPRYLVANVRARRMLTGAARKDDAARHE